MPWGDAQPFGQHQVLEHGMGIHIVQQTPGCTKRPFPGALPTEVRNQAHPPPRRQECVEVPAIIGLRGNR